MTHRVLVTGGAGFIGSAVVRQILAGTDWSVLTFDKLTYAGHLANLTDVMDNPRHTFVQADVTSMADIQDALDSFKPTAILHLAAESHVDRSISGPADFIQTNIVGTYNLLEASLTYWKNLEPEQQQAWRFLHVSTDEVYGSLGKTGQFNESSQYKPNSPYSASKAASDHLARAWFKTYGLPVITSNCSNNYGPYQFPEKLIPVMVSNAAQGTPLPVYGAGDQIRDWLYVDDHADALITILKNGRIGETYCIGGDCELTNMDLVKQLCEIMDEVMPDAPHRPHANLITSVTDRPGHDMRYAIDASKIRSELGWVPKENFKTGLRKTVDWYLNNKDWCETVLNASSEAGS